MAVDNGITLYHGSYTVVETPVLSKCEKGKDFGLGFYLTTNLSQAKRFVKSSIGKAIKNGVENIDANKGFVSYYDWINDESLKVYEFKTADSEWLHCVAAHRRGSLLKGEIEKWKRYDVIIGKIANDSTNQVITAYINGVYGEVGTEEADRIAISLLKPEKLTNQLCFRTDKAIESLKYVSNEAVKI